jgi:hypothetical protein
MDSDAVLTVFDYLVNKVRFSIPRKAMLSILASRGLPCDVPYMGADADMLRLAYADMLRWFLIGPSKVSGNSDSDNGWSHTEGGYQLSSSDRTLLSSEANAIYDELEPSSRIRIRSTFRITSHGIQRSNVDIYGIPIIRKIK